MDKGLIDQALECLSLVDIRLRTTTVEVEESFSPYWKSGDEQEEHLEIQFSNSIDQHRICVIKDEQKVVEYFYNVAFRIRNIDSNKGEKAALPAIAEVKATFLAVYMLNPEKNPSEETLMEFGKHNVGFNVWPYWREYAASTANKIGLPNIIVPLYRMPKEDKKNN